MCWAGLDSQNSLRLFNFVFIDQSGRNSLSNFTLYVDLYRCSSRSAFAFFFSLVVVGGFGPLNRFALPTYLPVGTLDHVGKVNSVSERRPYLTYKGGFFCVCDITSTLISISLYLVSLYQFHFEYR